MKSRNLTITRVVAMGGFVGQPQGFRRLAAFLIEYDDGQIPHTAATDWAAAAFRAILAGADAKSALQLTRKGRKPQGVCAVGTGKRMRVARFVLEHIDNDPDPARGKVGRAVRAAAGKFRLSESRVSQCWQDLSKRAKQDRDLEAALFPPEKMPVVRRVVFPREMEAQKSGAKV